MVLTSCFAYARSAAPGVADMLTMRAFSIIARLSFRVPDTNLSIVRRENNSARTVGEYMGTQ